MMNPKIFVSIIIIAVIAAVIFSHVNNKTSIALVYPNTGAGATYGIEVNNAIQLAFADRNISEANISLHTYDSECDRSAAEGIAGDVKGKGINIVLGVSCSGVVLGLADGFAEGGVYDNIIISPASTSTGVSALENLVYRFTPSDAASIEVLAKEILSNNHKKIAFIYEDTEYAKGLSTGIYKAVQTKDPTSNKIQSAVGGKNTPSIVAQKLIDYKDAAIFISTQGEELTAELIKELRGDGYNGNIYTTYHVVGDQAKRIAGSTLDGVIYTAYTDLPDNASVNGFLSNYENVYGKPVFPTYIAAAYESTIQLLNAIEEVGDKPRDIAEYLGGRNFEGIIGSYSFDENGDIIGTSIAPKIFTIENGR